MQISNEITGNSVNKMKCILGCESLHRLIDCENYMKLTLPQIKEFSRKAARCFAGLGTNHTARICTRKDSWKCRKCNKNYHHWTLCRIKTEFHERKSLFLDPITEPFVSNDQPKEIPNNMAIKFTSFQFTQVS